MPIFDFDTLDESLVRVHGALDYDKRDDGLGVRRLPSWTRIQTPQGLDVMSRMPSGVRIQFNTDATDVRLKVLTTTLRFQDGEPAPVAFQLETEKQLHLQYATNGNSIQNDPTALNGFKLERGSHDELVFSDLPNQKKYCEIWLPHNAFVSLKSIAINDGCELFALEEDARPNWVHYGSSISHCMEAKLPTETWPAVAARLANVNLMSFGFGGQCHLDQFVARTIRDQTADFISLKLGINVINLDSMKERVFTPAVHGFLDTIREKQPTTPITLISPIYCPSAESNPGPTIPDEAGKFQTRERQNPLIDALTLKRVREILENVATARREAGDPNISYFSGLNLLSQDEGDDLPDALHPSPAAYIRMGERFFTQHLATQIQTD